MERMEMKGIQERGGELLSMITTPSLKFRRVFARMGKF